MSIQNIQFKIKSSLSAFDKEHDIYVKGIGFLMFELFKTIFNGFANICLTDFIRLLKESKLMRK